MKNSANLNELGEYKLYDIVMSSDPFAKLDGFDAIFGLVGPFWITEEGEHMGYVRWVGYGGRFLYPHKLKDLVHAFERDI